jgi:hypothetical protein
MTTPYAEHVKRLKSFVETLSHPSQWPGKILAYGAKKVDIQRQEERVNRILAGQANEAISKKQRMFDAFTKIERAANDMNKKIGIKVKDIFTPGAAAGALIPSQEREKFETKTKKLRELASNPQQLLENLHNSTKDLFEAAPNLANSVNIAGARAVGFLSSKLPVQPPASPFSEPYKPSPTEIAIFNRAHQAVTDPLSVLQHIKNGTLTHEHVEAIQATNPQLYAKMQNEIMDQLTSGRGKDLPYSKKLMLSMFTGQDLTNGLKPQNIAMSQSILAAQAQPNQQKQPARSLSKIDKSSQLLTATQRVESGTDQA